MAAKSYEPIPESEFEQWLTPAEALLELGPLDRNTAAIQIQEAARSGLLETGAETISREPSKGSAGIVATFSTIPYHYWAHLSDNSQRLSFWETGLARMWLAQNAGYLTPTTFRCFNVRFKPDDVRKLKPKAPRQFSTPSPPAPDPNAALSAAVMPETVIVPPPPPSSVAPAVPTEAKPTKLDSIDPKDRRGPSPKDFWDDMLIAIFRRIYVVGWQPERLADLEKAMHAWLAERGKSAGERTIRNIATKLFAALKD